MNIFKEGVKLKALLWVDGESVTVSNAIKSITVVMVGGQGGEVPWAKVCYGRGDNPRVFNLAYVECVTLMEVES